MQGRAPPAAVDAPARCPPPLAIRPRRRLSCWQRTRVRRWQPSPDSAPAPALTTRQHVSGLRIFTPRRTCGLSHVSWALGPLPAPAPCGTARKRTDCCCHDVAMQWLASARLRSITTRGTLRSSSSALLHLRMRASFLPPRTCFCRALPKTHPPVLLHALGDDRCRRAGGQAGVPQPSRRGSATSCPSPTGERLTQTMAAAHRWHVQVGALSAA